MKNCRIMVYVFIEHKYINSLDCIRLLSNDSTVSSKTMSDDSVSNQSSRVSHSVGNRVGNGNRTGNSVGNGVGNTDNIGVRSGTVVGDLGDVAGGVVGVVVDVLDAAVGKVDGVGAVPHTGAVVRLGLLESGAGVVVVDAVLVGVGGDLGEVVVADSMGDGVSDSMGDRVCHCVHHGGSNCHSVTNSVTHDTMAKSVAKELRGRGGGGGEGSDAKEGLAGNKY